MVNFKIIRYHAGKIVETAYPPLGPFPSWFTLYELKLALWNSTSGVGGERKEPYAPPLIFIGEPVNNESTKGVTMYKPIEMVWKYLADVGSAQPFYLNNPYSMISGGPDTRFVDSAGLQKVVGKDNRVRMTLNDVFKLSDGMSIPDLHIFFYTDIIDNIPGQRPLGERDVYGKIMPYFPYLDMSSLPSATAISSAITPTLKTQATQTAATIQQIANLESLLPGIALPALDGVKLLRWVWAETPEAWEGAAVLFFGLKVTHERPFLRFFPASGQPLTKIRVRGILPIPDLPDPNLLLSWKQDKNPESGKESLYLKMRIQPSDEMGAQDESPVFSTMFVYNDGTADLRIQPPKKVRLLDPLSDLQDTPDMLEKTLSGTPFMDLTPKLAEINVVFKMRLKREATKLTKATLRSRLVHFTSLFQEIPPLPDEQPSIMLRFKGVSNFTNETRVFTFLTLLAERELVAGEIDREGWAKKVAEEFQVSEDEGRKQVVAWMSQRGEFALAVSDTKEYILNKNPGIDIAIFEQHPTYTFHIASGQDSKAYNTIINLLGIFITAPTSAFSKKGAVASDISKLVPPESESPAPDLDEGEEEFKFQSDNEGGADGEDAPVEGIGGGGANVEEGGEEFAFVNNDDDVPEFMKATLGGTGAVAAVGVGGAPVNGEAEGDGEEFAFVNNDDEVPEFMKATMGPVSGKGAPVYGSGGGGGGPVSGMAGGPPAKTAQEIKEEQEAAKAFEKPSDISSIQLTKYYIERLKLADPSIFNYQKKDASERGYVSHCAANEARQPIVLDRAEYEEMRTLYRNDTDIEFVIYPDNVPSSKVKKRQPSERENADGILDGKPYPSEENKEVITITKYGSKPNRINYYFCPRLFCIRDRLLIRYKDYKSSVNRFTTPPSVKPANSCPFCGGGIITEEERKAKKRSANKSILERKIRPGSESERNIYVGFLDRRTPSGLFLPCCFATTDNKFNPDDPEFVRLGLRAPPAAKAAPAVPALAQPVADALMGVVSAQNVKDAGDKEEDDTGSPSVKYDYYRVIQGVSVKSIVDSSRIPLKIVEPKTADDPKAGPQIGFLPEALDKYFYQDSTSDRFAERIEIVSKLKPSAQGFLRLGIDNSNKEQSFLSAVAPFFFLPNAEAVIEKILEPIEIRIPPKKFLQINGGNLVHEFFTSCDKKYTNDIRKFAKQLNVTELSSSNIPAIERVMCSYENFKEYLRNTQTPQRKDLRVFYDIFSEPAIMPPRGIIFIVLELTVEEISIKKGDKIEFKNEVKFENVRCPPYPLNEAQQRADIGFLVHYNRIIRDRYTQAKTYKNMGWDPLFYVDGILGDAKSRHKPTLFFQRSQESTWPPIVQRRVHEFFSRCLTVNRGPFTSELGIDPYALISAQEIITAVRIQPKGVIRDAYNHLVGVGYRIPGKSGSASGIAAVPISDDGTFTDDGNIFFDWDDFEPAPINKIIDFYLRNIVPIFPQYRGYIPKSQIKMKGLDKIIGLRLTNGFVVPASEAQESNPVSEAEYPIEPPVDFLDWDINNTIAYDTESRQRAFKLAEEGRDVENEEEIVDPKRAQYLTLKMETSQEEIEDVYQHLRLTFSNWLATGAGSQKRQRLLEVLKNSDMTLQDKRRRLDILLYSDLIRWLEPKETDEKSDVGFLRIDCQVQGQETCTGRCKWAPKESDDDNCGPCKIHSPKQDGAIINVPRMLYLRLVDELIRYAARREEIFNKQVPRLTIRRKAQRSGDQYIVAEGTSDWSSWWEILRTEWFVPEKEVAKHFDEQYYPLPTSLPAEDKRVLPESLKFSLDPSKSDPKVADLVWNPSTTPDRPFAFLKPVLRFHEITTKPEAVLNLEELDIIVNAADSQVLYMPSGSMAGSMRKKKAGSINGIIIAFVDGVPGWISKRGTYGIKIALSDLPSSLNVSRTL
jgi:hypothetical protein